MHKLCFILFSVAVGLLVTGCSTDNAPSSGDGPLADGTQERPPTPAEAEAAHNDALAKLVDAGVVVFGPPPEHPDKEDAQKVFRVDFGPDCTAGDEHLALLTKLQWYEGLEHDRNLHIHTSRVTDRGLSHLADFRPLNGELNLSGSDRITDAGMKHLSRLKLNTLVLANTPITNAGLANLRGLTVNGLLLEGTRVNEAGLDHLRGIDGLVQVQFDDRQISADAVRRLEKLLPECTVVRSPAK